MAFGEILNSSIGFLEVIIIIMLVREVIRLFSGSGSAGSSSGGGSGFKNAAGNMFDNMKNKWDKHIEKGNERHKSEDDLEKGIVILAAEGENELIRLKDATFKLRNGLNTPAEFLKALPQVEANLVRKMGEDIKAFRSNIDKDRKEVLESEKLTSTDTDEEKQMLEEIKKELIQQNTIILGKAYTSEEKKEAGLVVRQLNALQREIEKAGPERGSAIKVIDAARKALEEANTKSKPAEDLIITNATNSITYEIKRLIDMMRSDKGSDPSKRENELINLKKHSDELMRIIDDIKMHYDRDVIPNIKKHLEEYKKLKLINENINTLYKGIKFTAKT